MLRKKRLFIALQWAIMLLAYAYLAYKLSNVEYWKELKHSFENLNSLHLFYFLFFLLLMPVNWALEIVEWQIICRETVKLSFKNATKGVLAGLNTGFITPGRFGEFAGRMMFLPEEKRLNGIILTFVNSFIQTLVITVFGLIAAFFYSGIDFYKYLIFTGIAIPVFAIISFLVPGISGKFKNTRWVSKIRKMIAPLKKLSYKTLALAFFLSTVRFVVFCYQYYLVLCFFHIYLTPLEALIGIPVMYLLITYAPTLAASEAAVRGSFAVLVLGVYSHNEIGILLTGVIIWLVNFIVPMLAGSVFLLRKNAIR